MERRILALLLPLALLFAPCAQAVVTDVPYEDTPGVYHIMEDGRASLLPRGRVYAGQFADVAVEAWYYPYVVASYEYGLLEGRGNGFAPDANITVAELLTLSARLRAAYMGEAIPAAEGAWYARYASYLRDRGLLDESLAPFDTVATRAQLAGVFALSLPESCFDARNDALVSEAYVSGNYIVDVDARTPYQTQILWLYRQGLLVGMDAAGSYRPSEPTTRAEVAAVLTRMADPALRLTPDWTVLPVWSAAGMTLADLIEAPDEIPYDLALDQTVIDQLVRRMLAGNLSTIKLSVPPTSDMQGLASAFLDCVKSYCEQMYNSVEISYDRFGNVSMWFSASSAGGNRLAQMREKAMARAIEVHDLLWSEGTLHDGMSQYEIARVYFAWLCDNCVYDYRAVDNEYSVSHIAYSALVLGKAVCDGYTGAYNLFLKLEGIECTALPNDTHIWTVATLDGTEYHIDTTWGDQGDEPDWSYFGMSAEESYRAHPW